MTRRNRSLNASRAHSAQDGDRVAWMSFYQNTDKLVEQEMQQALDSDLKAALHLVESVHQDHWSW